MATQATQPKSDIFDYELYGVFLRASRQRQGYGSAEDFCRIVSEWTGVSVNKEALYRIEKGVQPPTVEQLMAFSLILNHGKGMPAVLDKTNLLRCMTPYAEYLAKFDDPIFFALTFDGKVLDQDAGDAKIHEFKLPNPGTPGLDSVNEYYFMVVPEE